MKITIEMPKESFISPSQMAARAINDEMQSLTNKYGTVENFPFYISLRYDELHDELVKREENKSNLPPQEELRKEVLGYFAQYASLSEMPISVVERVILLRDVYYERKEELANLPSEPVYEANKGADLAIWKQNILSRIFFIRAQQTTDETSESGGRGRSEKLKVGQKI